MSYSVIGVVFWSRFGGFLGCGRAFLALVIVRQERGSEHLPPCDGDQPRLGLIRYYLDGHAVSHGQVRRTKAPFG